MGIRYFCLGKPGRMPLVHFTLNVFVMGLGLKGQRSLSSFRNSIGSHKKAFLNYPLSAQQTQLDPLAYFVVTVTLI